MTAAQLKRRRSELEMSQHALAKAARMGRYNISLFESGIRNFTILETSRIEKALLKKEASKNDTNKKIKSE